MNKFQRRRINSIIRFYRRENAYTKCTSVRVVVEETERGSIWLTINTRRSDCAKYSLRQVYTRQYAHIRVGKRGAVTVCSAEDGVRDYRKHLATMLRGTVAPKRSRPRVRAQAAA